MLSKTLAKVAAWKFAKENGIDMVTINPGWVIGPLLQPTFNLSVEEVLKLLKGDTFPNKTHRWVDVRDVAMAHIQAYELPTARGRYCLVGSILHCSETMKILRKLYPALNLPEKCADDKPYEPTYMVSQEKTKSLGIDFTPLEVSLKDIVESLREKNFVSF
ncbi:cinnamoyl-CoA reductase 1-like [Vitis riparia]|uniref:cinnamoyl-CoA reductase 1-like n=1 Tax=Vitis riparia TaxID=96939 RepID=UPI00155A7662|nr:cinnamoyl-CoA reductase 1-like [Vitis riparia]